MKKLDKETDAEFDRLLMISRQLWLFENGPTKAERKRAENKIRKISKTNKNKK